MGMLELYDLYWNKYADPRVADLPFIQSPFIIPFLTILYLYIVLKLGPELMKDKEPYTLKTFIFWYNIFQIVINAYMIQQFVSSGWFTEISIFCPSSDYSYNPKAIQITRTVWIGTMVKLIDLIETVVFVLRKKYNQISFLHVYHHVSVVWIIWLFTKYTPVADASFPLLINCFVHVLMYSYYLLSSLGPTTQKAINSFKPWLTTIQMVQFVGLIIYFLQAFLPSCNMNKITAVVFILSFIAYFTLFYDFYQKSYLKSGRKKK